ncbi:MAG: succinate dehydrogenase, cytochrome b556 subunit [Micavibrio aeruginosavorus]|uniref:Succinate dehydrogenase cytochrome b556 subunit n=1 Tax=Micavibrio aeruginosavorus TaxID=349221 RepID=A0A2W5PRY1_9BACT|nr:MAG: succinate dehydrogenase, cytochrome b556 subunit [Micavibrio aeruginosavorus]
MSDTPLKDEPKTYPRPLSPHLQVYRLPMTALMSITHRMTGVALAAGCVLITAFLVTAAIDEELFEAVRDFSITHVGTAILFAWSLALYYHLCNGIRHLIWDTVHLLDEKKAMAAGWVVLLAAAGLTAATWYFASIY